jgi:hypothetical protein
MRYVRVTNATREKELGTRVGVANSFWLRLRGLLFRPPLWKGEGLLLQPCKAVHMSGMRYAVDVAFIDITGCVVAIYAGLAPGAKTRFHRTAHSALELPPGVLARTGTIEGDTIQWAPAASQEAA